MKESSIVKAILKYLKTLPGCFAWKEHGGMYGTAGIPDIIACIGGKFYGLEVKTERGKPTGLQEATMKKIQAAGGIATVVRSVADVKAVLEEREG
ncbi:MAG: VRR-NUC domain-containing protein [Selenomonadaceae bacterium]|nr:VRR-NUC domain-containing protein [Selenomonadaceae bacterium]